MADQSLQSLPELEISQIEEWEGSAMEIASYTEDSRAGTLYRETIYYHAKLGVYAVATNFHDSIDSSGTIFALCAATRSRTPEGDIIPSLAEYLGVQHTLDQDDTFRHVVVSRYNAFVRAEPAPRS